MKKNSMKDVRSKIELYSAGAGSGKTHTITERIVEAVRSGLADPQKVIAMTFTEKSALELRERIASGIKKASRSDPKLVNAVREIELARIGTIHSVCFALVKKFCFEVGVSAEPSVMSSETSSLLLGDAITSSLNCLNKEFFPVAVRLGMGADDWQDQVNTIVGAAQTNNFNDDKLASFAESSVQSLKACMGSRRLGPEFETFAQEKLREFIASLEGSAKISGVDKTYRDKALNFLNYKAEVRPWELWHDVVMNGSAGSADTREALAEFPLQTSFVNDCEIYIRAIFSLAINVRSEYAALKLASGTVDYNDMESYCFKLLGMDSVQESLVQELDFLVVDEFQDSSPLQLSIFLMLAQCAKSVIFVGDINQSIYGFRGTDSQLIKGFEEAIRSVNPKAIFKLPDSHRSDKNLVDFANQSFAQAFEGQDFTLNPLNHKQVGSMPFRPLGQDKRVAVWDLEEKSIAPCMDELAKHIKNLIESAKLQAYDKSEKKYRVLEYRDVAVLVRTNTHADQVCSALRTENVPVLVSPSDFCLTYEANLVLASLRVVIDSTDSIAKAEILGLYDGIRQEAWLEERIKHLNEKRDQGEWQNHHSLIAKLIELSPKILSSNMLESVDILLHEAGLLDRIMQWHGDELDRAQRLRILELMRAYARDFDQEAGGRRRLALHQELLMRIEAAERSSMTPFSRGRGSAEKIQIKGEMPGSSNAVKVLTYHVSKGLEYPMVIMLDLDSKCEFVEFGVHVECKEGGFNWDDPLANQSLRFWPWAFGGKGSSPLDSIFATSASYAGIYRQGQDKLVQEAKNLLYVGVTRARDYLVLIPPHKSKRKEEAKVPKKAPAKPKAEKAGAKDKTKNPFGEWAAAASVPWEIASSGDETCLVMGGQVFPCMSLPVVDVQEVREVAKADLYWFAPGAGNVRSIARKRYTPTSLPARMDMEAVGKVELGKVVSVPHNESWGSVGEALHQIISMGCRRDLKAEDVRVVLKGKQVEGLVRCEDALAIVSRLLGYCQAKWPGAKLHPEYPVMVKNERSQRAMGWIDLLIETDEGFVIIDHKSYVGDDLDEKALGYSGQLAFYREAVELATGRPVLGCCVHFMFGGRLISLTKNTFTASDVA